MGQLVEWEVWVEFVVRSRGRLHVFLPLLDRGVDALVHRLDEERWIPVQVNAAQHYGTLGVFSRLRLSRGR